MRIDNEIKTAVRSSVKEQVERNNKGMLATFTASFREKVMLRSNDVAVRRGDTEWTVTMGGKVIATGDVRFGKRGEVMPRLKYA